MLVSPQVPMLKLDPTVLWHSEVGPLGGNSEEVIRVESSRVILGPSLVVQWLRLCSPNAGGPGLIPDRRTRFHHTAPEDPMCCN